MARDLTCLCALGNKIACIPNSLGLVKDRGMLLELDADALVSPPAEVYAKGTSIALAYLSRLQDSESTRNLSLAKWNLAILPVEVTDLAQLTDLSVASNKISVLPPQIRKLRALIKLNLSNNLTTGIGAIRKLWALIKLNLSNNLITALPPELGAGVLTELVLCAAALTTLLER
ncbi:hypothetical protein T484DRAFT_1815572 [Baffinella frigidus]|nr:hypothetical protein T484DRAFT_1815572 [Cryptophyta sp. CCMP2293]